MKIRYRILLILIAILIVACDFVWLDYHKYQLEHKEITGESIVFVDEKLSINYLVGKSVLGNGEQKNHFSITNTSKETTYYYLNFMDVRNDNSKLEYLLTSNNFGINIDRSPLAKGNNVIGSFIKIEPGVTHSYDLMVYNCENVNINIDIGNELFIEKAFNQVLLENNKLKEATTKPGEGIADTNEGLIKNIDDDGVTYYFRGAVNNNYVKFVDKLWRIVRINGDGTIRIVLNDSIGNSAFYKENLNEDVSYNANYLNSNIKVNLLSFYESNLEKNNAYLSESNFCADNSITITEENLAYFSGNSRNMIDNNPTFLCLNNRFKAMIGLLSADEILYAGAKSDTDNSSYYLYNTAFTNGYYTLTPAYNKMGNYPYMITVNSNGSLINNYAANNSLGIRPVVNLRKNLMVTGTGTSDDPYIIES